MAMEEDRSILWFTLECARDRFRWKIFASRTHHCVSSERNFQIQDRQGIRRSDSEVARKACRNTWINRRDHRKLQRFYVDRLKIWWLGAGPINSPAGCIQRYRSWRRVLAGDVSARAQCVKIARAGPDWSSICAHGSLRCSRYWPLHLSEQFGAVEIPRSQYLKLLGRAVDLPRKFLNAVAAL